MATEYLPGFYGKCLMKGDFVSQRLPRSFLDVWDGWLQSAVASSRQQLGDDWLSLYLNGPIWRFALSAGICGEYPWCGVVMPSVDQVGRYFPLTLACPMPLDTNLVQVAAVGEAWFAAAEEAVLSALDGVAFDMDAFDARVLALKGLDRLGAGCVINAGNGFGSSWRLALNEHAAIPKALPELSHHLLAQRLGSYSLWWGLGSGSVEPSLLLCGGLPDPVGFAAMLSGDWNSGDWENWSHQGRPSEPQQNFSGT